MNVVQTGEGNALQRQKQQLRETAAKDEARAGELRREGVDELFTSVERVDGAAQDRLKAGALAKESARLRRNGREQSHRGLERLGQASDDFSQSSAQTEQGLEGLQSSVDGLTAASQEKSQGLETAKAGLAEQAVENGVQGANLEKLQQVNGKDAKLDASKAEQLASLQENLEERKAGLDRQTEQLDSYLVAGQSFAQGNTAKTEGFGDLRQASQHTVQGEAYGDASQTQKLSQGWAEAEQSRHQDASLDLKFSSLYQSLKAKAASLQADHLKRVAERDLQSADGLSAQAEDLKAQAAGLLRSARQLERSGQCHVAVGRQMQCCPWSFCQGVQLERQGCAELGEAQRLKCQAGEKRAEGQRLALQAEEVRARAEDVASRGEEYEVQSHGATQRSKLLQTRSDEHQDEGAKAGQQADEAGAAAQRYEAAAQQEKGKAAELDSQGEAKLEKGYLQQEEALRQQSRTGTSLSEELTSEAALNGDSQATVGEALKTVAREVSFLGRGGHLLYKIGASQGREAQAQDKLQSGVDGIKSGLAASEAAQARGEEAAKLLEQARDLELEGLRLQNRGQKMLLEARPKLAASSKLSAEAFDANKDAQRQEEEAAQLIQSGNEKIAAANILRDKAGRYKSLAQ
jgi:hypothetical protein